MASLIAYFSLFLLVLLIFVCLPLMLVQGKYGEKEYDLETKRIEDKRMSGYLRDIILNREYLPEILSYGLWTYLYERWKTFKLRFFRQDVRLKLKQTIAQTLAIMLMTISTAAATGYIVYVGIQRSDTITIGEILMYMSAFGGALAGGRKAFESMGKVYKNIIFLYDFNYFTNLTPTIKNTGKKQIGPGKIQSIEFRNVSFKYPGSSKYALQNINIVFRLSETVLIIGPNGSGKTTLVRLLLRLYEPNQGLILLNGINIKDYNIESLRDKIGVIFQNFIHYAGTVKENIGYGNINCVNNTDEIVRAAARAKADSFISGLEYGYDTMLSKQFTNGQELSIGQWQRICLARLFFKHAPICIFDEPAANLDIDTEWHLLSEIAQIANDHICILITHRLAGSGVADKIILLNNGKVEESGSYESLMSKKGQFNELASLHRTCYNLR